MLVVGGTTTTAGEAWALPLTARSWRAGGVTRRPELRDAALAVGGIALVAAVADVLEGAVAAGMGEKLGAN